MTRSRLDAALEGIGAVLVLVGLGLLAVGLLWCAALMLLWSRPAGIVAFGAVFVAAGIALAGWRP